MLNHVICGTGARGQQMLWWQFRTSTKWNNSLT